MEFGGRPLRLRDHRRDLFDALQKFVAALKKTFAADITGDYCANFKRAGEPSNRLANELT